MKKKRIIIAVIIVAALAGLAIIALGIKGLMPVRQTPTADYFTQKEAGRLTADEWMDYRSLQEFMNPPATYFKGYDMAPEFWKYGLAFTTYGLACIPYIESGQRVAVGHYIDKMVQKMKQKPVWEDWIKNGYGDDPVAKHNIMYKGHLNAMYGLHQLISGSTKWEKDSTWLTNNIAAEIDATPYSGVTCEPDDYFVQCNSIGIYSLLLYDKLHGTDHSKQVNSWLSWVKSRMIVQPYGLLARAYHPESDYVDQEVSGYSNGWSLTFLHAIDPAFAESLYPRYKKTFTKDILGMYAYASEHPDGLSNPMAHACAMMVSKEMGDQELFDKLLNSIEKTSPPTVDGNIISYKGMDKYAQGVLFLGKINIGLGKILKELPRN